MKNRIKSISIIISLVIAFTVFSGCGIIDSFLEGYYEGYTESASAAESIVIPASDKSELAYRRQFLSGESLTVYDSLYNAAKNYQTTVTVPGYDLTPEDISTLFFAMLEDYPEFFWYNRGMTVDENDGGSYIIELDTYEESFDAETAQKQHEEIISAADEFISGANNFSSDYDKAKYLHDSLAEKLDYDYECAENNDNLNPAHNLYGALVNKLAVCDGYAYACQYLLRQCSISAITVSGSAESDGKTENHAWNMVEFGGEWYNVDVTWDDASFEKPPEDFKDYSYFCISDEKISVSHTLDNFNYPACSSEKLNYYVINGLYLEDYSYDAVKQIINREKSAGKSYAAIQFADRAGLERAEKNLYGDSERIFDLLTQIDSAEYYPGYDTNILVIYFQ